MATESKGSFLDELDEQIIEMAEKGYSMRQIAFKIGVSSEFLQHHKRDIFRAHSKRKFVSTKPKLPPVDLCYSLGRLGCSREEVSMRLGISYEALVDNHKAYIEAYQAGLNELRKDIRSAQVKEAMKGDSRMLIWLGRNLLSQKDNKADTQYISVSDVDGFEFVPASKPESENNEKED